VLQVRCQAQVTLDAKGRLALPSAIRHALAQAHVSTLVVMPHTQCLWAMEPQMFEDEIERPMRERDPFAPDVVAFTSAFIAPAQDVAIDGQGRILVPPLLRELAGLERDVMVATAMGRIQLWDLAAWTAHFKAARDQALSRPGMPAKAAP
jgi:MraZ protein